MLSPAGKMSGLWSGQPVTVKLADLDVICVVLGCQVGDLLLPEPDTVARPTDAGQVASRAAGATPLAVVAEYPATEVARTGWSPN